ncbi:MAG: DUF1329 domain-containing protein [Stenotrophobium sp.]
MKQLIKQGAMVLALTLAGVMMTAQANVSPDEAAHLGKDLTAIGATRAGSADGSIPEYVGRAAFRESATKITYAQLEALRDRLVKDINNIITDPKVTKAVLQLGQSIMDSDPAKFQQVMVLVRKMLTSDAALKADYDKVLAGRGKSVDGMLSAVEQHKVKLIDLEPDILAVVNQIRSQPDMVSRMVNAFSIDQAMQLSSLAGDKARQKGGNLLMSFMPSYVKDFLDYNVPGKTPDQLLTPIYVVTASNMAQYVKYLSPGQQAMFKTYPDYKMIVYPSVRNAFFPDAVDKATIANATTAVLKGTDDLSGAKLGFPFPIPKSGAEVIWNHKLRFRGSAVRRYNNQAIVKADGSYTISKLIEDVQFVYANLNHPGTAAPGQVFLRYLQRVISPPRVAGQVILVHEMSSGGAGARQAWIYSPGLGRVNRAPDVGYDTPALGSDGEQYDDQIDEFNGSLDRYNWKLVGKREMLIPYNSWIINSPTFKYKDIIRPGHINQDLSRYELHRVWVVEANLKPGQRHSFSKRVFYLDEDSWAIAAVDCYDGRGKLWKVQEAQLLTIPFIPTVSGIPEMIYDLQSHRYFVTSMTNEDAISDFEVKYNENYFEPSHLRLIGRGQ